MKTFLWLILTSLLLVVSTSGFVPTTASRTSVVVGSPSQQAPLLRVSASKPGSHLIVNESTEKISTATGGNGGILSWWDNLSSSAAAGMIAAAMLLSVLSAPSAAFAADFAGQDISGQDFSAQDLSKKDFTSVVAKNTNFHNSNLQGATFLKANLVNADFSGADLRGATFVDAVLDGSSFKDVYAERAIFSASILDIGNLENADLTDSLWPSKLRIMLCDMDELKGRNPVTGVETQESVLCTDYTRRS